MLARGADRELERRVRRAQILRRLLVALEHGTPLIANKYSFFSTFPAADPPG